MERNILQENMRKFKTLNLLEQEEQPQPAPTSNAPTSGGLDMQKALDTLEDIWMKNQEFINENKLISFNSFGDFSLNILFIYYIRKEADIFDTQSKMSLQVLERFNAEGLEFAFPTQTIHTQSSN